MKVQVHVLERDWEVEVPSTLVERAVRYAVGVVGQRETAGMGEGVTQDKINAVKARFERIASGEWNEGGGGRAADPVTRACVELLRSATVRKAAKPIYKATDVPGSSDANAVAAFMNRHFQVSQVEKITAQAKKIAKAREDKLTL